MIFLFAAKELVIGAAQIAWAALGWLFWIIVNPLRAAALIVFVPQGSRQWYWIRGRMH
jgi:hypothetical protein